jgi:hypothetical protein
LYNQLETDSLGPFTPTIETYPNQNYHQIKIQTFTKTPSQKKIYIETKKERERENTFQNKEQRVGELEMLQRKCK